MPPLHSSSTRPLLAVCVGDDAFSAVVNEFAVAGLAADHPTSAAVRPRGVPTRSVMAMQLVDGADVTSAVEALFDGRAVIAGTANRQLAANLFDQGRRLAEAEWFDAATAPLTAGLTREHLDLLLLVNAGADVAAAAQQSNLSKRTAARRIAEARDQLGARSTIEAATKVAARVDQLRSGAAPTAV